jgi:hypothetical protein
VTSIDTVKSPTYSQAPDVPAPVNRTTDLLPAVVRDTLTGLERSRLDLAFLDQLLGDTADRVAARALAEVRQRLDRMVENMIRGVRSLPVNGCGTRT